MEDFRQLIQSDNQMQRMNRGGMVKPMQPMAESLADKGRFGDTMLVHMNPAEVSGLASLVPGGQLTTNPDTGQPEAFLPLLLGLLGSGLGATAGAGTLLGSLGALGAGAIGSGLGTTIETGSLKKGIQSGLMSGLLGGVAGKLFNVAGAAAGDAATKGLTGAVSSSAGAGAGASKDILSSLGMGAAKTAAQQSTLTAAQIAAAEAAKTVPKGIIGSLGAAGREVINPANLFGKTGTLATGVTPGITGMAGAAPEYDFSDINEENEEDPYRRAILRDRGFTPAPEGYRPGIDPEHNYFQNPFAYDLQSPEDSLMPPYDDPIRLMADGGLIDTDENIKKYQMGGQFQPQYGRNVGYSPPSSQMGFNQPSYQYGGYNPPQMGFNQFQQPLNPPSGIRGMTSFANQSYGNQPQMGYSQPQMGGYSQPQMGYAQPQMGYGQPQMGYGQPMGASQGGKNRTGQASQAPVSPSYMGASQGGKNRNRNPSPPQQSNSRPSKGGSRFTPTPTEIPVEAQIIDRGDPYERDLYDSAPSQMEREIYTPPIDISANPDLANPPRNLFDSQSGGDQGGQPQYQEFIPTNNNFTPANNVVQNPFERQDMRADPNKRFADFFASAPSARYQAQQDRPRGAGGRGGRGGARKADGGRLNNVAFEGLLQGQGGGMDDVIPANIDGKEPILVSRDEYVMPADVVSSIGDGSTNEGASMLDNLINNVRIAKNGNPIQPQRLNGNLLEMMEKRI